MRNEVVGQRCPDWLRRIRRGSAGILAGLAIMIPAAIRPTPVAAAETRETAASAANAPRRGSVADDPGVAALRRGEIDLVATYRTTAEDPCLILRREVEGARKDDDSAPIAMLVRVRQLDRWLVYFATAAEAPPPRALDDAAARMRWRTSRGVHAVAIDPSAPRAVEAAVAAWYAHCPPASEGSLMTHGVRAEDPSETRRFAARRIAR